MNGIARRRRRIVQSLMHEKFLWNAPWRTAKCLGALRKQVDELWPKRSKASDGTLGDASHKKLGSKSDHNPWVLDGATGVVTAIDITHDPKNGCDCESIVHTLVDSRDARIKYIIWNRRIISSEVSPWVWRKYSQSNPHTTHFHLSVSSKKARYDDESLWSIASD